MSALFTDTVTVYNHYMDPETNQDCWNRTVIKGVQWAHEKVMTTISSGEQIATRIESLTFDFQRDYGNKPYVDPVTYRDMDLVERQQYWTLDARDLLDVVVMGESDKELSEYRLKDLWKVFQYVATVREVSDNRNRPRLKHIKVVGV